MLLIASRSVSRRAGFATLAGIQAGTCHALAAALGLSQLFVAVPLAYDAVRFAGAAYLLYLAWKTFRSDATALPVASPRRRSTATIFRQVTTNLLNPKMALFVLALFPQFVRRTRFDRRADSRARDGAEPDRPRRERAVILSASRLSQRIGARRRPSKLPQYLLGSVFVGLAARLAVAGRQ